MEDRGEVKALYRDFKINLEAARDYKVSFLLVPWYGWGLMFERSRSDTGVDEGVDLECTTSAMVSWIGSHDCVG